MRMFLKFAPAVERPEELFEAISRVLDHYYHPKVPFPSRAYVLKVDADLATVDACALKIAQGLTKKHPILPPLPQRVKSPLRNLLNLKAWCLSLPSVAAHLVSLAAMNKYNAKVQEQEARRAARAKGKAGGGGNDTPPDPHYPYYPPKYFTQLGMSDDRLRKARIAGTLHAIHPPGSTRWHYSEPDAKKLWPDCFIEQNQKA